MFFWQVGSCNYTGFPRGNDCFGTSDPNSRCTRHFPAVSKLCKCILGHNVLSMNVDFFICFFTDQLKLYYQRTSHQEVASSVFLSENISSWWDLWSYSREKCPRVLFHPDGDSKYFRFDGHKFIKIYSLDSGQIAVKCDLRYHIIHKSNKHNKIRLTVAPV